MPKPHRNYDSGFRQEAVNLLLSSGRSLKQVAAESEHELSFSFSTGGKRVSGYSVNLFYP